MIDVTFTVNGHDWHELLSTYQVVNLVEVAASVTTLDGTEYVKQRIRPTIVYSFIPLTEQQASEIYADLSENNIAVSYTNPYANATTFTVMRNTSDLDMAFGLKSVTGDRYYKGGELTLRQNTTVG